MRPLHGISKVYRFVVTWIARTLPIEVSSSKWQTTERTCAPKKSKPKSGLSV